MAIMKTTTAAAAALSVSVALAGCTPNEQASTTPGTTPSVWTGSPAPAHQKEQGEGFEEPTAGARVRLALDQTGSFHSIDLVGQATSRREGHRRQFAHSKPLVRTLGKPYQDLVVAHRQAELILNFLPEMCVELPGRHDP